MLELSGSKSSYPEKADYLRKAGLVKLIKKWLNEPEIDEKLRGSFEQFLAEFDKTFSEDRAYKNADLSGRNLTGIVLQGNVNGLFLGANLSNTNLTDATLVGGMKSFSETNFSGANLRGATLIGRAAFQKANFANTDLQEANLKGDVASFSLANFNGAKLKDARLTGGGPSFQFAIFKNADLTGTRLQGGGSAFQWANFDDADLTGATILCNSFQSAFQVVNLNNTGFSGADLSAIDANALASCKFESETPPRYDAKTKFPEGFDPAGQGWTLIQ
jgi:uncharacterized protein YjbI with pentapeptide repeats